MTSNQFKIKIEGKEIEANITQILYEAATHALNFLAFAKTFSENEIENKILESIEKYINKKFEGYIQEFPAFRDKVLDALYDMYEQVKAEVLKIDEKEE